MTFRERVAKIDRTASAASGIAVILLLGVVDYLTGYEFRMDLFYLVPVSFAAWYLDRRTSIWYALICVVTSVLSDVLSGKVYTAIGLDIWNLSILLGFYLVVAVLLSRLRATMLERSKLIGELQDTLKEVKELRGILPICSSCKKIRTDEGYWQNVEDYISHHTHAEFSHGICRECAKKLYPEYYARMEKKTGKS